MSKINFLDEFEKMRPYNDQEVNPGICRLINYPEFDAIISYLFPERSPNEIKEDLLKIDTVDDFQSKFVYYIVASIINKSSAGLTVSGTQNLVPGTPYLFVSNHRDIVLDAAILQDILLDYGHKTSQITFGDNLMSSPLVIDLGKLNKMFTIYRGGTRVEMYKNALIHSAYIRNAIMVQESSVWIAQRNGRTKDGNDITQSALFKMLIGTQPDPMQALRDLNIVPLAVSYEFEPCDAEKTREIYLTANQKYAKSENEDLKSVLSGITSPKGRIHFSFGKPLNTYLEKLSEENLNSSSLSEQVASEIDKHVHSMLKLFPNNYIAFDMLSDKPVYNQHYTIDEYSQFKEYVLRKCKTISGDQNEITKLFLQMYAKPVENRYNK